MVIMDARLKKSIKNDPNLAEHVIETYKEIEKLINYYTIEVKMNEAERLRAITNGNLEEEKRCEGLVEAYNDNLFEIRYILEILRGKE